MKFGKYKDIIIFSDTYFQQEQEKLKMKIIFIKRLKTQ